MWGIMKTTVGMVEGFLHSLTAMYMMASGLMILDMEREYLFLKQAGSLKVNGMKIKKMVNSYEHKKTDLKLNNNTPTMYYNRKNEYLYKFYLFKI